MCVNLFLLISITLFSILSCETSDKRTEILEDQIEFISHISIGGFPDVNDLIYPENGEVLTSEIELLNLFTEKCKRRLETNNFLTFTSATPPEVDPYSGTKVLFVKETDSTELRAKIDESFSVTIKKICTRYWELISVK